jgi:hypothetical protein
VDPIAEACRRGSILAIVRVGNIDLEAPNTPAMDAPSPYQKGPPHTAGAPRPGTMPPGLMPPNMMNAGRGMMPNPGMPMPPRMQQPQQQQGAPVRPGIPTNLIPPPSQPQQRPAGPVGQLPDPAVIQQAKFATQGRAPTQAELAAQSAGLPTPPEKKPASRRWFFGWGSDSSANKR